MEKHLLIADDDESVRDIFNIIFSNAGYNVQLKSNAEDVLRGDYRIPDLFLIDKRLGAIDGLHLCRHLKSGSRTMHIPIIIVSACPDISMLSKNAGADDYIEKPFHIEALLKKVESRLNVKEGEKILSQIK